MRENLKKIYFIISIILVLSLFLNYFDFQYAGYWTEKIIAWFWIFSTFIFILIFLKKYWMKYYLLALNGLILLSIIPMGIPFFGIINYLTKSGDYQQIKLNEIYRIERTQHQPLSMTRIYVYKKIGGILEKNICRPDYREVIENVMNIKNSNEIFSYNLKETPIQDAKLKFINRDSIGIEYKINDAKKIVYHKLRNQDGY